ncbi:hypothetical protein Dimus_032335 [Dionaea muscipula]
MDDGGGGVRLVMAVRPVATACACVRGRRESRRLRQSVVQDGDWLGDGEGDDEWRFSTASRRAVSRTKAWRGLVSVSFFVWLDWRKPGDGAGKVVVAAHCPHGDDGVISVVMVSATGSKARDQLNGDGDEARWRENREDDSLNRDGYQGYLD